MKHLYSKRCLYVLFVIFVGIFMAMMIAFSSKKPAEILSGTEGICFGIVEDYAMASLSEARWEWEFDWWRKREHRSYISMNGECFWAAKGSEDAIDCSVGDYVKIEYGIEQGTDLLVVTGVTVLQSSKF